SGLQPRDSTVREPIATAAGKQKAQKWARIDVHILEIDVVAGAGLDRVLPGVPAPMPNHHDVAGREVVIPIRDLKAVVAQIDRALVVGVLLLVVLERETRVLPV